MCSKKSHHFHPWKNCQVFRVPGKNNVETSRKSQHPLDVDSRPNWGVTRKVGGKVVLRSDMDAAREPFNRRSKRPMFWTGRVARFFGRELIEHGKVETIEKPIENKHSAFLGINVIDMYMYKCLKCFSSLEFHWNAFTNSHEPTGGGGGVKNVNGETWTKTTSRGNVETFQGGLVVSQDDCLKRTSGCLRKLKTNLTKRNQLQKDVKILPSPNMWNICSTTRMTWHICWSDRLPTSNIGNEADHPRAWQWSPAPPHVVHAAVHGTEAVRSAVLKVQGLATRITTHSDHYLVHPGRGIQALNFISSCENARIAVFC